MEEPDALAAALRARARAGSRASRGGSPRASTARRARPRARTRRATASRRRRGRGCRPGRSRSARRRARRRRPARRRSRRGRRGTTAPPRRRPRPRRSPPRRRVCCRGCLTRWRRAWLGLSSVRCLTIPPAGRRRGRTGGGGGRGSPMRPRDGWRRCPSRRNRTSAPRRSKRAVDFRSGQLLLYGLRLAIELGVLVLLVRRPPARLRGRVPAPGARRRGHRRGAVGGALGRDPAGLGHLARACRRRRARHAGAGPATRSTSSWAAAIGAVIGAAGGALSSLIRRFPRRWWVPAVGRVVAFGVVTIYAGPVVLDPLFNTFTPLPDGELRADVLELARAPASTSARSTRSTRPVARPPRTRTSPGSGHTKRVVLYDTLLENFSRDEVRLVVAHELGHVHYDDVQHGLLYLAIVAPFGMFAVARLTEPAGAARPLGTPAMLPALALGVTVMRRRRSRRSPTSTAARSRRARTPTRCSRPMSRSRSSPSSAGSRCATSPTRPAGLADVPARHPPAAIERIGLGVAYERGER